MTTCERCGKDLFYVSDWRCEDCHKKMVSERDRYHKALEAILAATDITGDGFDDADNALTDIYEIAAKALKEENDGRM